MCGGRRRRSSVSTKHDSPRVQHLAALAALNVNDFYAAPAAAFNIFGFKNVSDIELSGGLAYGRVQGGDAAPQVFGSIQYHGGSTYIGSSAGFEFLQLDATQGDWAAMGMLGMWGSSPCRFEAHREAASASCVKSPLGGVWRAGVNCQAQVVRAPKLYAYHSPDFAHGGEVERAFSALEIRGCPGGGVGVAGVSSIMMRWRNRRRS
ncbi:MAG: hypothetical protein ACI9KE_002777 [Polyangiales bacterium]|jgi:hypothetical protein